MIYELLDTYFDITLTNIIVQVKLLWKINLLKVKK